MPLRRYAYLNPSTDALGRLVQSAAMQLDEKSYFEAEKAYRAILKEDPGHRDGWSGLGYSLRAMKQHAGAAEALARSASGSTDHRASHVMYDAAAQYALAGRNDDALTMLERAFALGYPDRDAAAKDPDLAALRSDPRLKKLIAAR